MKLSLFAVEVGVDLLDLEDRLAHRRDLAVRLELHVDRVVQDVELGVVVVALDDDGLGVGVGPLDLDGAERRV